AGRGSFAPSHDDRRAPDLLLDGRLQHGERDADGHFGEAVAASEATASAEHRIDRAGLRVLVAQDSRGARALAAFAVLALEPFLGERVVRKDHPIEAPLAFEAFELGTFAAAVAPGVVDGG